jgi:cobalt/nickel transport system permease protein
MHLGHGQITPMCAVYGAGIATLGFVTGLAMARKQGGSDAAKLAAATGFVFAMQAFNVPALPGVSGHLIGGFLLAHWFGAGWGMLATTLVLLVQSLLVGDGAVSTLGCNVLNMAVLPCLVAYPLWKRFFGAADGARKYVSLGVGAYASVLLAALACSLEVGKQAIPSMLATHAAIGAIEVLLTLSAIIAAEHFSIRWAPLGIAAAVAAALFGSSPWPDGLEYSVARTGLAAAVENLTPFVITNAAAAIVVGCVVVMTLTWAAGRGRRVA